MGLTAGPSWDLHRTFLAVLEEGSLSGAARALGLTQPTVGRHVDALEEAVGFELFVRSPHGLVPTEGARELRPYAEALAATAAALLRTASAHGGAVKGAVRVTASRVVAVEVLPPVLAALREAHPELVLEVVASNAVEDLLRRDADVAVRMVAPAQEALVVKKVGAVPLGLHAHPRYLARRGTPERLGDLAAHDVIGFDRATPALRAILRDHPELERASFALRTDDDLVQLGALRAGLGIGVCQVPLAARAPTLVRVLPDAFEIPLGVWVAMHENLRATARVRVVFEALAAGLAAHVGARPEPGPPAG